MSVEILNKLHACGAIFLGNPPAIVRNFGLQGLTRLSAGVFRLGLVEPLDFLGGGILITPAADTARMISARFRAYADEGPDNILINAFDAAGAAADIGECYIEIRRFPTSGEPAP